MGAMRAKLVIAGVMLASCALSTPAHAEQDGCVAIGTHAVRTANHRPWDCFYTATGPSTFAAATSNPFVIAVSRDGGGSWIELFRRPVPGAPTGGRLETLPGDLVSVSISCWHYPESHPCGEPAIGGRDGIVWAQSDV